MRTSRRGPPAGSRCYLDFGRTNQPSSHVRPALLPDVLRPVQGSGVSSSPRRWRRDVRKAQGWKGPAALLIKFMANSLSTSNLRHTVISRSINSTAIRHTINKYNTHFSPWAKVRPPRPRRRRARDQNTQENKARNEGEEKGCVEMT